MKIRVTTQDIRRGVACDCFNCPVAEALQRATKDRESRIVSHDWNLMIVVNGRWLLADDAVADFVHAFDDLSPRRNEAHRPELPKRLPPNIRPFTFTIPPLDDPEWQEECYGCEELFAPAELDDQGYCTNCRDAATISS
jgi:hypothetical protein